MFGLVWLVACLGLVCSGLVWLGLFVLVWTRLSLFGIVRDCLDLLCTLAVFSIVPLLFCPLPSFLFPCLASWVLVNLVLALCKRRGPRAVGGGLRNEGCGLYVVGCGLGLDVWAGVRFSKDVVRF